jgi:uncharacterized protein YjaG (DUF416 family)
MLAILAAERQLEPWMERSLRPGADHGARLPLVEAHLFPPGALPPPWRAVSERRGWVLLRRESGAHNPSGRALNVKPTTCHPRCGVLAELRDTEASLGRLSKERRTAFACLAAERLLPHYKEFQKESGWGDVSVLRLALDLAWRSAAGRPPDHTQLETASKQVRALAPDTEDAFTSTLTSVALDAAAAVCGALQCARDGEVGHALDAAQAAFDTVAGFADIERPTESRAVHALVERELRLQRESLAELEGLALLSTHAIERLRFKYSASSLGL